MMLLSRVWYIVVAICLAGAAYLLVLSTAMYNRMSERDTGEVLTADSQVVDWYLRNDARQRAAELIKPALDRTLAKALLKSSDTSSEVPKSAREEARSVLAKVADSIPKERGFDALFAVDQHGRVVAQHGYPPANGREFELGGYPVVADALHGYVRDDVLSLNRLYRVVARPVEYEAGLAPAGAIVGARLVDDRFAREVSERTGTAVAFYWDGNRKASFAPEGFDRTQLDAINSDLGSMSDDTKYMESGRSAVRDLPGGLQVIYSRLPGESWETGAGYAVGKFSAGLASPFAFFSEADDKDKSAASWLVPLIVLLVAAGIGLGLTFVEHTRPLRKFRREVHTLETGGTERLRAADLPGAYREAGAALNDAIDRLIEKSGGRSRRGADLGEVLGDLPAEPVMSAFAFPGDDAPSVAPLENAGSDAFGFRGAPGATSPSVSSASSPLDRAPASEGRAAASFGNGSGAAIEPASFPPPSIPPTSSAPPPPSAPQRPPEAPERSSALPSQPEPVSAPPRRPPSGGPPPAPSAKAPDPDTPEEQEMWRSVFDEFVATRERLGDSLENFTYEKFERTLRKNRGAIQEKHGCRRVRFRVYVKEGKAALKASPVRD